LQCRVVDKAKSNYNSSLDASIHTLNRIYSESTVEHPFLLLFSFG